MASDELDPLIKRHFEPSQTAKIVEAVATSSKPSTKKEILESIDASQTSGGSSYQRIIDLIAYGVLQANTQSNPNEAQTYQISPDTAELLVEYYQQRIAEMQGVLSALVHINVV